MPETNFDEIIDRTNTGSLKWDRYVARDVLPMWVADMDFASPPAVIQALHERVEHGVFGYTRPFKSLEEAVVNYLRITHEVEINPEWLVWVPGCVPALSMCCAAAGEPGARVLTTKPVYPPFLHVHRDSQRLLSTVSLAKRGDDRYEIDWEALEAAVTPETRVFLFCNPHNPVGRVFSRSEVAATLEFCQRHDLLLCSDEIHCDLVLDAALKHQSVLSFPSGEKRGVITLMGASKTYNVAGLACTFAVVPDPTVRRRFKSSSGKLLGEISPLGFAATEAAYRYGEPWRQELITYLRGNRDRIADFVAENIPSIQLTPVEATYLAWLDLRKLNLASPREHFETCGLGLSDGNDFGAPGFARLNFGCPRSRVEQALLRMRSAVEILG